MSRIIVIVGGSTTGKTDFAYSLAKMAGAAAVVCGDQYQLVGGFPLATGAVDSERHAGVRRELYGVLAPTVERTLSADEYAVRLNGVLSRFPDELVVIDGLSLAYFPILARLRADHRTLVIGTQPRWTTPFRVIARMWRLMRAGVVTEIRNGAREYGAASWYIRNSFVPQEIIRHGVVLGAIRVFWKGLTGEAICGKNRRMATSGEVDLWV